MTILFMLFLGTPVTHAANQLPDGFPTKDKLCPKGDCRESFSIRLITKDGEEYRQEWPYFVPVVQPIGITIFPKENIRISGEVGDAEVKNIRVTDNDTEQPLIEYNFEQNEKGGMLLKITNHSKHTLKYQLAMMPLDKERLLKTSSCPVPPSMTVYEHWSFPIYQLLVPKIMVLNTDDSMKCVF